MRLWDEVFALGFGCLIVGTLTDQWLLTASLPVLWAVWRFLRLEGAPPVLAFAFSYHWGQVVIGLFYFALTGREPMALSAERYVDMVAIGLVCVLTFVGGIRLGDYLVSRRMKQQSVRETSVAWSTLLVTYFAILAFRGALRDFAWENQGLAQGILAITYVRFALFYLILRRLVRVQRFAAAAGFVIVEVVLGMTGFFAEFREPLFIAAVVLAEQFDYRKLRHWVSLSAIGTAMLVIGVIWIGIRGSQRENIDERSGFSLSQRLTYTSGLAEAWWSGNTEDKMISVDALVDRMWDVYYPALALARVPATLPFEGGKLMMEAVQHVLTPRILVPSKADVESDSLQVRRYTGMMVAGPEQNTTISFGYEIQGYIDYGVPGLFVPVFLYAVFMGAAFRFFLRALRHRELSVSVVTVIFWMSLYSYNRSWAKMLGLSLTMIVYLGGITFLFDRYLAGSLDAADELAAAAAEGTDHAHTRA